MQHSTNNQAGFTLIETLVALTIITIGIIGPLTLLQRSLNATVYAKEKVTAIFLAEDALEYLKNVRDSDALSAMTDQNTATDYFFGDIIPKCLDKSCKIETTTDYPSDHATNPSVTVCSGTCAALNYSPSLDVYSYKTGSDWAASVYTRTIIITKFASGEYKAQVKMTWKGHTVVIERNFQNIVRNI